MIDGTVDLVAAGGTSDSEQKAELKEPVGISNFLPRIAAEMLVQAAELARQHPIDSFERRRAIEDAIVGVKNRWPEYFRKV